MNLTLNIKNPLSLVFSDSSVIFISEVLVLLLIGVPMFLVAVRKNKQMHGDYIFISLLFFHQFVILNDPLQEIQIHHI